MNVACSIQYVTEEVILKIANQLYQDYGIKNLYLAGGVALNCVANGKFLKETQFKNIGVQPAAGDAGGALGAAYSVYYQFLNNIRKESSSLNNCMKNALLGPNYDLWSIKEALRKNQLTHQEYDDESFAKQLALLISKGKVIGWFNG